MKDIVAAGAKTVQRQPCFGYNFTSATAALHLTAHGTLWFSAATRRVVEMTEVGLMRITAGSRPMATSSTTVYSRWNDPTIKLPAVPAS